MATKLLSSLSVLGSVFSKSISKTYQSLLRGRLRQHISKTYLSYVCGRSEILSANFFFQEVVIFVKLLKLGCQASGLLGGRCLGLLNWNSLSLRKRSDSRRWMLNNTTFFSFSTCVTSFNSFIYFRLYVISAFYFYFGFRSPRPLPSLCLLLRWPSLETECYNSSRIGGCFSLGSYISEKSTNSSCLGLLKSSKSCEKEGRLFISGFYGYQTFIRLRSASYTFIRSQAGCFSDLGFLLYCLGAFCSMDDCGFSLDKVGVSSSGIPSAFFLQAASNLPSRASLLNLRYSSQNSTVLLKTSEFFWLNLQLFMSILQISR